MRLIDADTIPYCSYLGDDEPRVYKSHIDAMPTVDPVKHGYWVEDMGSQYDGYAGWKCFACGYESNENSNFCGGCGARMDGSHDN